ncbi:hypothetical protein FG877_15935 [Enterococcus casseliflavus]|nr:hypothetical protein [Enterococcus casseliflavus]
MDKQKVQRLKNVLFGLFIGFICLGIGLSLCQTRPDQLDEPDTRRVGESYELISTLRKELEAAKEPSEQGEAITQRIRTLGSLLSSYELQRASQNNSHEGQVILNRYYSSLQQLGANTSRVETFIEREELIERFLSEIALVEENQEAVFTYYGIREAKIH